MEKQRAVKKRMKEKKKKKKHANGEMNLEQRLRWWDEDGT